MDPWEQIEAAQQGWASHLHQTVIPVQGYVQHDLTTLLSLPLKGGPPATAGTENETIPTEVAIRGGGGKASPSVSILSRHLFAQILVATAETSLAILRLIMMITFAAIVNRGYCFLNVFRSGRRRSCPFATYGARSAPLNDALGVLIYITYACSVNDEELFSSPPLGARTHGLPMMTDWKSLSASYGPIHTDLLCNGDWHIRTVVVT